MHETSAQRISGPDIRGYPANLAGFGDKYRILKKPNPCKPNCGMGETSPTDWVIWTLQFSHFALDCGMGETSPTDWVFLTLQFYTLLWTVGWGKRLPQTLLSTVFRLLPTNGKHELLATVWTEYMAQIFNPECLGFSGRDYGFWAYILNSFLVSVFVCSWFRFWLWDQAF